MTLLEKLEPIKAELDRLKTGQHPGLLSGNLLDALTKLTQALIDDANERKQDQPANIEKGKGKPKGR
jgi:hypothetical protein